MPTRSLSAGLAALLVVLLAMTIGRGQVLYVTPQGMNVDQMSWEVRNAINEIRNTYGADVTVEGKGKSLLKFGSNSDIDQNTTETVMQLQGDEVAETYVAANLIDTIVSSNAGDTQAVVIEGHTISGSDLTFVTQSATLTGQTTVALSTPLARVTRLYNNGTTNLAGTVVVFENSAVSGGVVTDKSKIHIAAVDGQNQSLKAATALSSVDYCIMTSWFGTVTKKNSATVDFRLRMRRFGKVFRTIQIESASSAGDSQFYRQFRPYIIIPPNSDILVDATSSANDAAVGAGFDCILAIDKEAL